jgi:ParB-like chromosome segregation protein Spo0J/DNA modification methylase
MALVDPVKTVERPVASIIVDRESRQRTTLDKDIKALSEQIERAGLINPIVIHEDGRLIAGERRLEAHKLLGYKNIRCSIFETMSENDAFLIELQENLARRQLCWQDEAKAVLDYHEMRRKVIPMWTNRATSQDIGCSEERVRLYTTVAKLLGDPDVAGCTTLQGAFNLLKGRAERAQAAAQNRGLQIASVLPEIISAGTKDERTAAVDAIISGVDITTLDTETTHDPFAILEAGKLAEESLIANREAADDDYSPIITGDFLEWVQDYDGPKFDVLHIDFPYGKSYTGSNTRKTGKSHIAPRYADDPDIYWNLLEGLLQHIDKIAFPIAHIIFWFDMDYYAATRESFERADWKLVQPHPLVWAKPYEGVAADPRRRPRHCYETALLLQRGDRKITKLDQDFFVGRTDEKLHINQKPVDMLKHFLSLVVDEHSAVLDPTCGSGSALAAAKDLRAARILGLELDPSNAEIARFVVNRSVPE